MKNIITASIEFYFKGEKFSPSITIDLNEYLNLNGDFPNLCALIATKNKIDHYSYEYEMMQAEQIKYPAAEGLVKNYITDGVLNVNDFISAWLDSKISNKLQSIAKTHMGITNLSQEPDLETALLEAYKLGKQDSDIV